MSGSRNTDRKHRRKAFLNSNGVKEHAKRIKRRKKKSWLAEQLARPVVPGAIAYRRPTMKGVPHEGRD